MPASKYSLELQDRICERIAAGASPAAAAQLCGISERTHYNWMRWGEEGKSEEYVQYFQGIKKALSALEEMCLLELVNAAKSGRWQASAWILERMFPEKYAKKGVSIDDALKVLVAAILDGDEHVARQLRSAVAEAARAPSA